MDREAWCAAIHGSLGLDGVPGGDSPDHQLLGRGTSDHRVMGTHRAGILPPGWPVVSSSGPGTGPSLGLHSRLSPEGGLRSVGALAAGSTQARGRGKEERWDLGSGALGTKVPGPCASEFHVTTMPPPQDSHFQAGSVTIVGEVCLCPGPGWGPPPGGRG